MRFKNCPSCGGDTSAIPVKKRQFAQFLLKVVRCPHCRLRNTFLDSRRSRRIKVVFHAAAGEPCCSTNHAIELDHLGKNLKVRAEQALREARALREAFNAAVADFQHVTDKIRKPRKAIWSA
jgi:hypothetical protein